MTKITDFIYALRHLKSRKWSNTRIFTKFHKKHENSWKTGQKSGNFLKNGLSTLGPNRWKVSIVAQSRHTFFGPPRKPLKNTKFHEKRTKLSKCGSKRHGEMTVLTVLSRVSSNECFQISRTPLAYGDKSVNFQKTETKPWKSSFSVFFMIFGVLAVLSKHSLSQAWISKNLHKKHEKHLLGDTR